MWVPDIAWFFGFGGLITGLLLGAALAYLTDRI